MQKQLETVSMLIDQHKELQKPLKLKMKTLLIQQKIDKTPTKGYSINWNDESILKDLFNKVFEKKLPLIYFLDPLKFDIDLFLISFKELVQIFVKQKINKEELQKLLRLLKNEKISLLYLIEATLREDIKRIKEITKELNLKTEILLYLIGAIIQPCIEEIARKFDSKFYEKLWQGPCPICGRIPVVAKRRSRKRFLICTYCGTEYLSDAFVCIHCDNKDPYTLKFIVDETNSAFKIDFCTKCNHYTKVLEVSKIKDSIPKGMEDILTLNLDFIAKDAGLVRN